jgi:hypothetical protein
MGKLAKRKSVNVIATMKWFAVFVLMFLSFRIITRIKIFPKIPIEPATRHRSTNNRKLTV